MEARKYFVEPHIPGFAEFDRWKGKKVLEIGCGIGTDTISFARAGAQVTAVDLTEKSLEVARQRARVFGHGGPRPVLPGQRRKAQRLPCRWKHTTSSIPSASFITRRIRSACSKRSASTSRPNSTVKIMVYNRWSWKVLWILFVYGKGQFWKTRPADRRHTPKPRPAARSLTAIRAAAGRQSARRSRLRVTETTVDHIFPYSIPEYVKYQYKQVWYFRWMPRLPLPRPGTRVRLAPVPDRDARNDRRGRGPYLSLVVTARNDDHGGNLLGRMQAFVGGWIAQAAPLSNSFRADHRRMESARRTARRSAEALRLARRYRAPAPCASSGSRTDCTADSPTPRLCRSTR